MLLVPWGRHWQGSSSAHNPATGLEQRPAHNNLDRKSLPVQITVLEIPGQIPGGNCLPSPSSITHGAPTDLPHAPHQQEWGIKRCSQHLMGFLFLIKFNTHYNKSPKRVLLAQTTFSPTSPQELLNTLGTGSPCFWDDPDVPEEAQAPLNSLSLQSPALDTVPFPSWALRLPPVGTEGQQQHKVQGLQVQQSRKS